MSGAIGQRYSLRSIRSVRHWFTNGSGFSSVWGKLVCAILVDHDERIWRKLCFDLM